LTDEQKANFFQHMRSKNVKPPNLGQKDHPKGPCDALAKICVVVSGTLDSFERADMEKYVQDHGGKVSKTVTSKVTHLVTDHGEAGPAKLAKCKELGIPVVSEDVILQMVSPSALGTASSATETAKGCQDSKSMKKHASTKEVKSKPDEKDGSLSNAKSQAPRTTTASVEICVDAQESKPDTKRARAKVKASAKRQSEQCDEHTVADESPSHAKSEDAAAAAVAETCEDSLKAKLDTKVKAIRKKRNQQGEKQTPTNESPGDVQGQGAKLTDSDHLAAQGEDPVAKKRPIAARQRQTKKLENAKTGSASATAPDVIDKAAVIAAPARRCSKKMPDKSAGATTIMHLEECNAKQSPVPQSTKKRGARDRAGKAEAATTDEALEETTECTTPGKRKAGSTSETTPPKKTSKKTAAASVDVVDLDAETLSKADSLSLRNELQNLAGRPELQGKGLSAAALLQALQKTDGLVNPAKHMLLGI
jgi:hypothetical protein